MVNFVGGYRLIPSLYNELQTPEQELSLYSSTLQHEIWTSSSIGKLVYTRFNSLLFIFLFHDGHLENLEKSRTNKY